MTARAAVHSKKKHSRSSRFAIAVAHALLACLAAWPSVGEAVEDEPWDLDDYIPTKRVTLQVDHRTRYEYLNDQFRAGTTGNAQGLVLRTLLHGRVKLFDGLALGAELEDSRVYESGDLRLNTTIVNAVELLRAYAEWRDGDLIDGDLRVTAGRITMDVGSRRFVARNRYRNTINGFTGVDAEWKSQGEDRTVVRAFWTLPVFRLPAARDQAALRANRIELDQEDLETQFWGLFLGRALPLDLQGELYVFGLHEDDTPTRPTRNRQIYTTGARILRARAAGEFDYQLEFALQWGRSRASGTSTTDLDHFAHFEHVELGYTFDVPWQPRVSAQYDYASGNANPGDGRNGRFDTLFGARRFDFGPTGIYGPFARSNINTPGIRVQAFPSEAISTFVAYRAFWLAEARDQWVTTGVVDPTGQSGTFVGHQIEWRGRWQILPGNLLLEVGYAHLFAGEFMERAPNSPKQGDSEYVYTQVVVRF